MFKHISAALVIVLAAIALLVAIGKFNNEAMWFSIFMYWVVLTVKNVIDFIATRKLKKESK